MLRVLALVLFPAAAFAGTAVTWERVKGDAAPTTLTLKCEGQSARFDGAGTSGAHVVIWDAPKKTLNVLRVKDKTYTQITEQMIAEMKERSKAMMATMKEKMAALPPEQRLQYEAMMAQAGMGDDKAAAEWSFKPTGKKQKVGKWDCELYEGERNGFKTDFCMVPWPAAPAKKEELECVKSISALFSSITRGMAKDGDGTQEDLTKFPGLPVQTIRTDSNGKKNVSTIKSVERNVKVPPDAFVVPADFKLSRPEEMMTHGE